MGTIDTSIFDLKPVPRAPKDSKIVEMSPAMETIYELTDYKWTMTETIALRRGITLRRTGELLRKLEYAGFIESRWLDGKKSQSKEHRRIDRDTD